MNRPLHPIQRAASIAGVLALAACGQPEKGISAAQPPPQVSVAKVLVQPLNDWAEYEGRLESPESVDIRPRVSGMIERVHFRDGSRVTKGQLLFKIDARPYQAEVNRLQAQLQHAQAQEQRAQSEASRGVRLRASNAISTELADARQTALLEARSAVAAAAAQLELARLNLGYTRITAPIDGHIGRAQVTSGNLVTAGSTHLSTLVSTQHLYAYFDIDEGAYMRQVRSLLPLQAADKIARTPAKLVLATQPDVELNGHLDFLDNQVNSRTGTLRARAIVSNAQGALTPGLYARIQLPVSINYAAMLVRDEAIGTDQGQRYVLVIDHDGVARYRSVTLGPKLAGLRVIRNGLREGEQIVVNGLQRTRPGGRVTAQPVQMADEQALARLAELAVPDAPVPIADGTDVPRQATVRPQG